MRLASALLLSILAGTAGAAPFDDLKEAYATCLRSERGTGRKTGAEDIALAFERCAEERERLERADPRRLRDGYGLSPSSWQAIESVFGPGDRRRRAGLSSR